MAPKRGHLPPEPRRDIHDWLMPDQPHHHEKIGQSCLPLPMLHVEVETEALAFLRMRRLPGRRPGDKGGDIERIGLVVLRKSSGDVGPLALHRGRIDEREEGDHEQKKSPVPGDCEARRDQKVKTLFGRIRPIPDINGKNANLRGFAERTAVNTPLQGTAADLIKIAMIRIDDELTKQGLKSRMTLQVHDELVFEVPETEVDAMRTLVRDQMEKVHALTVPLLVEIGVGPNWRDLD